MITVVTLNPAVDKTFFIGSFSVGGHYRVRNKNIVKTAGGKGINVSRVVAMLGEKVTTIGFKAGGTGEWLESQLMCMGVDMKFIKVEGETRTTVNVIDKSTNTETEIIEVGPNIKAFELDEFYNTFKQLLKNTKVLVCTGGLPEGVPVDIYKILIEMSKHFGIKTILDAENEVLKEGIKAKPDLIKPNLRELSDYTGRDLKSIEDILYSSRKAISEGVQTVVASLGKEGALLVKSDLALYSKPPVLDIVNTIGSGDSMIAGFAVSLLRDYSVSDSLKLGMACAASNTQFMEVGLINSNMIIQYSKEINVEAFSGV